MRYDLAFFLCCCRSFLSSDGRRDKDGDNNDGGDRPSSSPQHETYYVLLGVDRRATPDELKRAYKRRSLEMHPDKLAQRGKPATSEDRDRFTRMRHAYEVLSDARRRETYDAVGERGMKWIEEPLSVDPQELARNFATSSVIDRSKIFGIFLAIYVSVFLLPVLVCLMVDGKMGPRAKWVAALTPLWVWDSLLLFYHTRVVMMGPIKRPDHVSEEEWVDPLPMAKRVLSMIRFAFLVVFEVLFALKLDGTIASWPWYAVFAPIAVWEALALRKKILVAMMQVVSSDQLELILNKNLSDCTPEEREDVHRKFVVVPPPREDGGPNPLMEAAMRIKAQARGDVARILVRVLFEVLLVVNLDADLEWSYWTLFVPVWVLAFGVCAAAFRSFADVRSEAARRDPDIFGTGTDGTGEGGTNGSGNGSGSGGEYTKMEEGAPKTEPLSDEERDELRVRVTQSAYRAAGTCCGQCFFILLMCLFVGKLEGAAYSSLWIVSPFLLVGGTILCCLGCTIFCISEVDEFAGAEEFEKTVDRAAAAEAAAEGGGGGGYGATDESGPSRTTSTTGGGGAHASSVGEEDYRPPASEAASSGVGASRASSSDGSTASASAPGAKKSKAPKATWDPERGEVWVEPPVSPVNVDLGGKGVPATPFPESGVGDASSTNNGGTADADIPTLLNNSSYDLD